MFAVDKPLCRSAASRAAAFKIVGRLCGVSGAPSCNAAQQTPTASPGFLTPPMCAAVDALYTTQRRALPAMLNAVAHADIVVPSSSSISKHVGLANPGNMSYQNSVLQQLFMIPRLQAAVLSAMPVAPAGSFEQREERLRQLRNEFQRTFVALSRAQQAVYDPQPFVRACEQREFFPLSRSVRWLQRVCFRG